MKLAWNLIFMSNQLKNLCLCCKLSNSFIEEEKLIPLTQCSLLIENNFITSCRNLKKTDANCCVMFCDLFLECTLMTVWTCCPQSKHASLLLCDATYTNWPYPVTRGVCWWVSKFISIREKKSLLRLWGFYSLLPEKKQKSH